MPLTPVCHPRHNQAKGEYRVDLAERQRREQGDERINITPPMTAHAGRTCSSSATQARYATVMLNVISTKKR